MTTLREAALMALKALEFGHLPVADQAKHRDVMSYIEAMDVLRKALDADSMASLPDPVAWVCEGCSYDEKHSLDYQQDEINAIPIGTLLYTHPPRREWQGLTDEEIWSDGSRMGLSEDGIRRFAREIEAKLKEKNT